MEDCKNFLQRMEKLKPYMVEFEENSVIKKKIYPSDCVIYGSICCPIIVITYDECIFSANNSI